MSGKQILINSTFGSRGVLSVISRSSVGVLWQDIREVKEVDILTKVCVKTIYINFFSKQEYAALQKLRIVFFFFSKECSALHW